MSEEKPSLPISEEVMNFSFRDGKKLSSRVWHQNELLNKKRRWLMRPPVISISDGSKKKSKRPKFLTDVFLRESYVRSDEVSYENLRTNVETSFGAFGGSQKKHHVVQDYLQVFESLNMESYSINPSHILGNLYSMMSVLSNNALCLVANLVTNKKVRFEKTRPRMKEIIRDYLPKVLEGWSFNDCQTLMNQLSEIFREPSNFWNRQLTFLTPVSPSLLSSICKALEELDEMPFQDLIAFNRKLRDTMVVPQFPPARLAGKRNVLLERVKKRCQKVLSTLKEGDDLPKSFAKALSIVHLSLKQKTKRFDIMASEFYPFSQEIVGLQNDILGALWTLPNIRIHELKALQPVLDPILTVPRKTFRTALRKYLMEYLFYCDVIDIPDEVLSILASLNRSPRRRPRLFSVETMDEDIEAALNISSQLKQTVSNLLPDDRIDKKSEDLGSCDDTGSNDFDLAENGYCFNPNEQEQGSCINDQAEGMGDSGVAFCSAIANNHMHSHQLTDSYMVGDFAKEQPVSEQDDSTHFATDQSYSLHVMVASMAGDLIKTLPIVKQDNYIDPSQHYPEQASMLCDFAKSNLDGDDTNCSQHCFEQASMTDDFIKNSSWYPSVDKISPEHCPEEALVTVDMRGILIKQICDETSLVAYRLVGHMLDGFLRAEGRGTNEMTRYYLRGGSSLGSQGTEDSKNSSKEEIRTKILVHSVRDLLPNVSESCIERVKKLML